MTEGPPIRVHQLAAAMGKPTTVAVEELKAAGFQVTSAGSRVSWADARRALMGLTPPGKLEVARNLVLQAFETARSSGRQEWRAMSVAVMKNRLLDLTDGAFRETDYGAPTFGYFVSLFPDLLEVELLENRQPLVRLKETALTELTKLPSHQIPPARFTRLRADLWRAFFDFHSGRTYVWDVEREVAESGTPDATHILIPTLSPTEEAQWRQEFLADLVHLLGPEETTAATEWQEKRLGTDALPAQLRGPWNGNIRAHVESKVRDFFQSAGLTVPVDLLSAPEERQRSERISDTARLRSLIQRCVNEMTHEELAALPLPAGVVMRVQTRAGRSE